MSDVFRARFDGREWWARDDLDSGVALFTGREPGIMASYRVPAHMVERIEDIPPEPTEPGSVVYDRDDVAWRIGDIGAGDGVRWRCCVDDYELSPSPWQTWPDLNRERGPLHPYPKAARDEIEALRGQVGRESSRADDLTSTLEATIHFRDQCATQRDEYEAEKDAAWTQVAQLAAERDELQRRIDRAQRVVGHPSLMAAILRGES